MDTLKEASELELLKDRADRMGITYHPTIGLSKLKEKVQEKLNGPIVEEGPDTPAREAVPVMRARLRKEANQLVRIRLTCMNPDKKDWPGEIISISNSVIGTIKKFIPFEAEDGYHVPLALLGILEERRFQMFYVKKVDGKKIKKTKLAKEFAIERLDPLTIEELRDLAAQQAMAGSLED